MISLVNERGEPVNLPPEGITIRDLFQSFGHMRLKDLQSAVSLDTEVSGEKTQLANWTEEINGLIPSPSDSSYTLIESARYTSRIDTILTTLASGSCETELRVDGQKVTPGQSDAILLIGSRLTLVVSASSSPANLAFTVGTVRI